MEIRTQLFHFFKKEKSNNYNETVGLISNTKTTNTQNPPNSKSNLDSHYI